MDRTYIAGLDCVPTVCRKIWESDRLLRLERDTHESGNVYIPWQVEGHGELLLCTATLMERDRPYHLPVELARGSVNRLRTKAETWKLAGLRVPDSLAAQIQAASQTFIRAATSQRDEFAAATAAEDAIRQSSGRHGAVGGRICPADAPVPARGRGPSAHAVGRKRGQRHDACQRGAHVSSRVQLGRRALLLARHPARARPLGMGAVRQTGAMVLPARSEGDWRPPGTAAPHSCRTGWQPERMDLAGLAKAVRKFVETAVERYRNQVHLWHVVAATTADPWLGDDQKLRLSAMVIETARRRDPRTPVFLSVDQPWGESLGL